VHSKNPRCLKVKHNFNFFVYKYKHNKLKKNLQAKGKPHRDKYSSTFATSTLIILFIAMSKKLFKKNPFSKKHNFMRENTKSFEIFKFSTWNP
jgi:hypothetical protein